MAGEGAPGQRDHRVFQSAAMPAFRRVSARASGGIQCQAAALDRPGRRERGAGGRGYPPLPVRGPALPGARCSRGAAGGPGHHPRRRGRPFPCPRRSADIRSRRLGDRYPGRTVPVHSQCPPAVLRCCVRGPRTAGPAGPRGRTGTVIPQDTLRPPAPASIAGGLHHAMRASASWFCVYTTRPSRSAEGERRRLRPPGRIRPLLPPVRRPVMRVASPSRPRRRSGPRWPDNGASCPDSGGGSDRWR